MGELSVTWESPGAGKTENQTNKRQRKTIMKDAEIKAKLKFEINRGHYYFRSSSGTLLGKTQFLGTGLEAHDPFLCYLNLKYL